MEIYLIYIVKVILLQTLLFGFYSLIGRKSIGFQFNRFFLLAALILPFFIPLIKIPIMIFQPQLSSEGAFDPWYLIEQSLPGVVISGGQKVNPAINPWIVFAMLIYLGVAIPSFIKFLSGYYKIYKLGKESTKKEFTPLGFQLLYVPSKILSFSFLDRIFLSNLFSLKSREKNTIITHEEYHLTQRHSLDIILSEMIRILCWFNPVIMLIQKNLKETHEYLADRHTIITYGKNDYTNLLRSFKWQEINMVLGNAYSGASIKNRLHMIEKTDRKNPFFQMLMLCIVTLFTALLFACENELDSFENKDTGFQYEFSEADLEKEMADKLSQLENAPSDLVSYYIEEQKLHPEYLFIPEVRWITKEQEANAFNIDKIKSAEKIGPLETEVAFFRKLDDKETKSVFNRDFIAQLDIVGGYAVVNKFDRLKYMEYFYKMNSSDAVVHSDFDKAATFKGGMAALAKHLEENLKYPELAKAEGIEDKLVMRFVVTKHGGLVYLNVDQEPETANEEISLEFQKAAFQALHSTEGLWEPAEKEGKYVMSKLTLPIHFSLEE